MLDGETVIVRDDGSSDFRALRSKQRSRTAALFAFDLIEHDGDDLRDLVKFGSARYSGAGRAERASRQFGK